MRLYYRRSRAEMPAHDWEVQAALDEGVELREVGSPARFLGENGKLSAVEWLSMRLGAPDAGGRRLPRAVPGSEKVGPADVAVLAIGLRPSTAPFAAELERERNETVRVDPETLATSIPGVFAGGNAVTGPAMIVEAIGRGARPREALEARLPAEPHGIADEQSARQSALCPVIRKTG